MLHKIYLKAEKNELACSLLFIFYPCDLVVNHEPGFISTPDTSVEISSQLITN